MRERVRLLTAGHGTLEEEGLVALLREAGVTRLVDVRSSPGSRRNPQFTRAAMEGWVPSAGIDYRWEPDLGGFRRTAPGSVNTALRNPAFRGYADHMRTPSFRAALEAVLAGAAVAPTALMCAESLWWRCHRRLLADAALLLGGAEVLHLLHDGRLEHHRPTEGVRREGGLLVYDGGAGQGSLWTGAEAGTASETPREP
jgi:uncharacterized protein (DUF488 family)